MKSVIRLLVSVFFLVAMAGGTSAEEYGTREEAKELLERAVVMLKDDQARALDVFTTGAGGFFDRDLYVFCGGADGYLKAHRWALGNSLKDFVDSDGKAAGEEMYSVAKEGEFAEVSYRLERPGEEEQINKTSFITKVGDLICGVGYYEK